MNSQTVLIICNFSFPDIFTQISDSSGYQVQEKFEEYLKAVLALPTAVCEGPSFGYNDTASRSCFDGVGIFMLMYDTYINFAILSFFGHHFT